MKYIVGCYKRLKTSYAADKIAMRVPLITIAVKSNIFSNYLSPTDLYETHFYYNFVTSKKVFLFEVN